MRTRKKKARNLLRNILILLLSLGTLATFFFIRGGGSLNGAFQKNQLSFNDSPKLTPKIKSKQAILINLSKNQVVASKKADAQTFPASVTKVMTAYIVTKKITDLEQLVEVPSETYNRLIEVGASMAGFYAGEWVPAKELLYGLMLPSGAEATVALADQVAGSEAAFVELMNQTAEELGMSSTHFTNTTGLHDANHYTTASDLAKLLQAALKEPVFREVFTTKEHQFVNDYHPEGLLLESRLFSKLDSTILSNGGELLGGKTGYTDEAGQCLASLATVNGEEYILITLGADGNHETDIYHIEDALKIYGTL